MVSVPAELTVALALAIPLVATAPTANNISTPDNFDAGFKGWTVSKSTGGSAVCISGNVAVSVTSTNVALDVAEPANQTVVTEYIQELTQSNSQIGTVLVTGSTDISDTYDIDATLCYPADRSTWGDVQTVQILTHGIGLDKSYWDIAPGYSHVDAAVAAGYATLAYNRLGVGYSDHPDPIQVVQAAIDVEVQHGLTQLLREGGLASIEFPYVVATGHSYGSIIVLAQNGKYPSDADAAVLTGFVSQVDYLPDTVLANNPIIASQSDKAKWGSLSNGYLVHDSSISYQLPFFRSPYYDPDIFDLQFTHKQTYTLGQQFTLPTIFAPASSFAGPVDVVVGQYDFPFCHGDCNYESDLAAATQPALYPAGDSANSQSFIVPNSGHCINAHYAAQEAFDHINNFLASNNL